MQQFTVPQFIDVEAKIIGPITTRQFLIFLGAALIVFVSYKVFDFALFLVVTLFVVILAGIFAFLKINGQPFHLFLLNLIKTFKKPGLRVWNNKVGPHDEQEQRQIKYENIIPAKNLDAAKLAELSLVADTKGKYKVEEGDAEKIKTVK